MYTTEMRQGDIPVDTNFCKENSKLGQKIICILKAGVINFYRRAINLI